MKRIFVFAVGLLLAGQAWAESFTVGNLCYTTIGTNNEVSVKKGDTELSGALEIPAEVEYGGVKYSVTKIIDPYAFSDKNLTSVTIPNSITVIGEYAFYGCLKLSSVNIPNSVTEIGNDAFDSCWELASMTIPNSVTKIGDRAFSSCGELTSITIPSSVTKIGKMAFGSCNKLTGITVVDDNTNYSSEGGILFNKDKTKIMQYPGGKNVTSYTIPNSVKIIE